MLNGPITRVRDIRHAHLFCGIGVGARGFNRAAPQVGNTIARFVCTGGIDVDPGAIANFDRMTGARGTVRDLFSRDQYTRFHGKEPPREWVEATPDDIKRAFGPMTPDTILTSPPCKGLSALLSTKQARTDKYQALNELTVRGVWLVLEAYKDDPVPVILFENVPRILTRGRFLLDQITALLRGYGYSVNLDTHDCGVIGGLAQSRKRALIIARHMEKVPPFIYRPKHHRLRGVGEVIGKLPLPGDPIAGPMHRVPALQWKTWVRLALVPAGKDWRALHSLRVENGVLTDFGIVPDEGLREGALGVNAWDAPAPVITAQRSPGQGRFSVADPRIEGDWNADVLGVRSWTTPTGAVCGRNSPSNGAYSVADPRPPEHANQSYQQYGVNDWTESVGTVSGQSLPGGGAHSVADPRPSYGTSTHRHVLGVHEWIGRPTGTITGDPKPSTGANSIADPRLNRQAHSNVYRVIAYDTAAIAITSSRDTAVADPRPAWGNNRHQNIMRVTPYEDPAGTIAANAHSITGGQACVADARREHYQTGGHYGVLDWDQTSYTVNGSACHDNGFNSVADPRETGLRNRSSRPLPQPDERLVCRIIAPDGTWHRPFSSLDLAALQAAFDPEEIFFEEDGQWHCHEAFDLVEGSDVTKREWIGNAIPGAAATGIAETIGETLLLADAGEAFFLSSREIWAKPGALALTVHNDQHAFALDSLG